MLSAPGKGPYSRTISAVRADACRLVLPVLPWVLLIVSETISAQSGIGYMTMNAREFLQTDVVLVGILLYALLGKLADVFARALERYTLRWHPGYR